MNVIDCLTSPRFVTREELGKPGAYVLDATAENRHIWGKNKMRDDVVFFDKEPRLRIQPDVLGNWRDLSKIFAPDTFKCAVFDPPFYSGNAMPYFLDPKEQGERQSPFYGVPFSSKGKLRIEILIAQREISIVSKRMCLKWMNRDLTVDQVLTLFTEWRPVWIQPFKGVRNFNNGQTFWVKLVRRAA